MAVMGGRVIPMFTNNGVPGVQATRSPWIEKLALGGVLLLLAADLLPVPPAVVAALAFAAAVAHALRLCLWQPWRTGPAPLVWVLHLAYGWIVVYLVLRGLAAVGVVGHLFARSCADVGAIGGMTIGMMTRTARGHTGRPLIADRFEIACYAARCARGGDTRVRRNGAAAMPISRRWSSPAVAGPRRLRSTPFAIGPCCRDPASTARPDDPSTAPEAARCRRRAAILQETVLTFPTNVLPDHHRHCDHLYVAAEEAAQRGDWTAAESAFERFRGQMNAHFDAEESLLFPAFEAATGSSAGPTAMMRHEHDQMRALLAQLAASCDARDGDAYAGAAETLLMLMQQHNMKEENILYPMCDQALGADAERLGAKIGAHARKSGCLIRA